MVGGSQPEKSSKSDAEQSKIAEIEDLIAELCIKAPSEDVKNLVQDLPKLHEIWHFLALFEQFHFKKDK